MCAPRIDDVDSMSVHFDYTLAADDDLAQLTRITTQLDERLVNLWIGVFPFLVRNMYPPPAELNRWPSRPESATSSERSGIWAPLTVMPILWLVRLGSFGKPSSASTLSTVQTETSTPPSLSSSVICPEESSFSRHSIIFCRVSADTRLRCVAPSGTGSAKSIWPWVKCQRQARCENRCLLNNYPLFPNIF